MKDGDIWNEAKGQGVGVSEKRGGFMKLDKEDSEMLCSALSSTTTTSILLVKSDEKFPWSSPVWVGYPKVRFQSTCPRAYHALEHTDTLSGT